MGSVLKLPLAVSRDADGRDWRHRAACRTGDPERFHPVGNSGPALDQIEAAKAECRRCPVIASCRAHALKVGEPSGVWGGLSEDERTAIRRRQDRQRQQANKAAEIAAAADAVGTKPQKVSA